MVKEHGNQFSSAFVNENGSADELHVWAKPALTFLTASCALDFF